GMDACIKKNADENKLYISEARADQGPAMKRRWLHARGQSTQFKKEFCHIIISLTEKDDDSSRKITQIKKNRDQVRFPNNRMSVSTKVSAKGKE
ncbi:hypothetical protein GW889_02660, partial [Candidatus Berkelbacteria bacterium]|nr:hypothetical protein [Candidatus Berkelbacteria bacterium]